ncbi:mechanosensitive ion channel family protein [Pseudoalteromonas fenneropenaei]|uniref:Mechanosensitive ion channel family protein n=1 Tax=Pseudoalteromonas fenneropenaei TaxID=1737459 RepID=A0ABV7CMX4_9GAMM
MTFSELFNHVLIKVGDFTLLVGEALSFLAVLLATFIISKILRRAFNRLASRQGMVTHTSAYVIGRIIHYLVLFVGFLIALMALGVKMTELALVASALGVGIGLGLQSLVNNFVSGLMILLEKSLKVGDFIEIDNGLVGEVKEIQMRATLIRTNDNVDILIPNAVLTAGMVTNWTLADNVRRFRIPFSVAYGSDKEMVRKAALEAAANVEYTLQEAGKEPLVWMTGFGDSSLNFTLGVWVQPDQVKRPTSLMSDYLWAIDDAFRKYNIEIPFPQRDLHIRTDLTKQ